MLAYFLSQINGLFSLFKGEDKYHQEINYTKQGMRISFLVFIFIFISSMLSNYIILTFLPQINDSLYIVKNLGINNPTFIKYLEMLELSIFIIASLIILQLATLLCWKSFGLLGNRIRIYVTSLNWFFLVEAVVYIPISLIIVQLSSFFANSQEEFNSNLFLYSIIGYLISLIAQLRVIYIASGKRPFITLYMYFLFPIIVTITTTLIVCFLAIIPIILIVKYF